MITGLMDIIVDAIPTCVYFTAINENDTPRKGPKTEPENTPAIAFLSVTALATLLQRRIIENRIINPANPAKTRICEAAKAL